MNKLGQLMASENPEISRRAATIMRLKVLLEVNEAELKVLLALNPKESK